MRKPLLNYVPQKLAIVAILFALISFTHGTGIDDFHPCNEDFQCGIDEIPFKAGQQYFYTFELASTLTGSRFLTDITNKIVEEEIITKNGSLMITPLNSCEILISLSDSNEDKSSQTLIKVAFQNGNIQRVCSSSKDTTDSDTNILRALSSLLQENSGISIDSDSDNLANDIILQNDSQGICLVKYEECSINKFIKYKLIKECSYSTDIFQNMKLKALDLHKKVETTRSTQNLCEESNVMDSIHYKPELGICIMQKNDEGLITSSHCKGGNGVTDQDRVSLIFEKVGKNGTPPKDILFYLAGLKQQGGNFILPNGQNFIDNVDGHELRTSINSLASKTERDKLNTLEVQQRLDKIKYALRNSIPELQIYLNELIMSDGKQEILLILNVAAGEASNSEEVLEFLQNTLELVNQKFNPSDLEPILRKLLKSTSTLNYISTKTLHFSKFILDYTNGYNQGHSKHLKASALTTFTQHLELYCRRIGHMTGNNYCMKNELVQGWIQSEIWNQIESQRKFSKRLVFLEGFSTLQEFSNSTCQKLIDPEKDNSQTLWTVLNCYGNAVCSRDGKKLHTSLLKDTTTMPNIRIAAFLALMKCSNDKDFNLIEEVLNDEQSENSEVSSFIKIYLENRILKGVLEKPQFLQTLDNSIAPVSNSEKSAKLTRASNTLVVFPISGISKAMFETNILYFENLAMIPQFISVKLSLRSPRGASTLVKTQNLLQVDMFIDDARTDEQPFNFHVTAVLKINDKTLINKDFPISEEALLQLVVLSHRKIARNVPDSGSVFWLKQKLLELIAKPVDFKKFELGSILNGRTFETTLSGIQKRKVWKVDGFARISITKDDCTDFLSDKNETNCQLKLHTDFNVEGKFLDAVGLGSFEKGFLARSNFSGAFPLSLAASHTKNDQSIADSLKFTIPSSILQLFGRHDHRLLKVETLKNEVISSQPIYQLLTSGEKFERKSTMNIEFYKTEKNITINIVHPYYEASLEDVRDSVNIVTGKYTCLANPNQPKTYTVQVGAKNSDSYKKLQAKLVRNNEEYSLDAYYKRQELETNNETTGSFLGCRGQGILCTWPFCSFCSVEYFYGATISTPNFKNIKLFEGSITQEYPRKRLDILFKTGGIPIIRNGEFKLSLQRGTNTTIFQTSKLKDSMGPDMIQFLSLNQQSEDGDGDALSEAESLAAMSTTFLAYALDAELNSEVLGNSGVSILYMDADEFPHYDGAIPGNEKSSLRKSISSVTVTGGGIFYPSQGQTQKVSLFTTQLRPNITGTNISREHFSNAYLRSTQFHMIDFDLNYHLQKFDSSNLIKQMITLKPFNIVKGDIRVEVIDKTGNMDALLKLFQLASGSDMNIDRTYKIYLPRELRYHIFKGKIILKKTDGLLEQAAFEALIGFENAIELKYEVVTNDNEKSYKLVTSIMLNGETFGLHHRIDGMSEFTEDNDDLISIADDEMGLEKRLYRGTYIFGEIAMRAYGIIMARKGSEFLPFSKFGVRTTFIEDKTPGPRFVGSETITDGIHNMHIVIRKGNTNLFEMKNEIQPTSQVPIKSSIVVKDFADVKIHHRSNPNLKTLEMKAKWTPNSKIITGKISFPNLVTPEEPSTFNAEVSAANENDIDNPFLKITSTSSFDFGSNFSIMTGNTLELQKSKWEIGIEGFKIKDGNEDTCYYCQRNYNASVSAFFVQPNLKKYSGKIAAHQFYRFSNGSDDWGKLLLNFERPEMTPLKLHLEYRDHVQVQVQNADEDQELFKRSSSRDVNTVIQFCHKDNFLYMLPGLNVDFHVASSKEFNYETEKVELHKRESTKGKSRCFSKGIYIPLCNELNLSYQFAILVPHEDYNPWWVNITATNEQQGISDEVNINLLTSFESVRPSGQNDHPYDESMLENILITVGKSTVFKNIYNFDYDLQRKLLTNGEPIFGINGTYTFTKMYESLNFFEFSDNLQWSQMDGRKLHIWTNLLNHSADSNLTSASATFSSQYVSLGDGGGCTDACNVTWMELRTMLNSNGFGNLQSLLFKPYKMFESTEGEIQTDFLIRTEFSPLKTLRFVFSHDVYKSETDEDDDSQKYGALTKLNGIINEIELTGTNSLTIAQGKLLGIGDSLITRYRSPSGIYEYLTIKAFLVAPSHLSNSVGDNLIHFDSSSSWTNIDDDDSDLRIVSDIIYSPPLQSLPLIRLAYFKNSTDLDFESNRSLLMYQSQQHANNTNELRLFENILSDGMDELGFTQVSLQSISQQIIEDYLNITGHSTVNDSPDLIFEAKSRSVVQSSPSNYDLIAKWTGFREKLYYCQSSLRRCTENEDNVDDTSNYCNLILLPLKPVIYLEFF